MSLYNQKGWTPSIKRAIVIVIGLVYRSSAVLAASTALIFCAFFTIERVVEIKLA